MQVTSLEISTLHRLFHRLQGEPSFLLASLLYAMSFGYVWHVSATLLVDETSFFNAVWRIKCQSLSKPQPSVLWLLVTIRPLNFGVLKGAFGSKQDQWRVGVQCFFRCSSCCECRSQEEDLHHVICIVHEPVKHTRVHRVLVHSGSRIPCFKPCPAYAHNCIGHT